MWTDFLRNICSISPARFRAAVLCALALTLAVPRAAAGEDSACPEAPVSVDWDGMAARNPDIIGWLYVGAMPHISYPILYSGDNDYYLHRNDLGEEEFRGSIFMEQLNHTDFADPDTILYGHNMADGTMFGALKFLDSEEAYAKDPYFYILTPSGNYTYKIFSMFFTEAGSDVYLVYDWHGPEFLNWQERWKAKSDIKTDVPLSESDHTVILTTCTSDASMRFVVFGKCISNDRPTPVLRIADIVPRTEPDGLTVGEAMHFQKSSGRDYLPEAIRRATKTPLADACESE